MKKILLCAAILALLLSLLAGCVYYVPAPDGDDTEDARESTAEDTTAAENITTAEETTAAEDASTAEDATTEVTAAPTDRDNGYTGYH